MTETPILQPDEPAPLEIHNGEAASDFFLICEHAGRLLPRGAGSLGLPETELTRHIAWDIGARDVATALADRLAAPLFMQRYSRLFCDCNRKPHVASFAPEVSEATVIPGNRGLREADRQRRAEAVFWPFHNAVTKALDRRLAQKRLTLLVTIHSFTPVFLGKNRPWQVGVMFRKDKFFAPQVTQWLTDNTDFTVGINEPYKVSDDDYTVPVHGEGRDLPHVEFEIRNDLIPDRQAAGKWANLLAQALNFGSKALS
ncbi:MAG: N-formylglutamate amidohydrolase [Pseudomonadota bacterium]